MTILSNVAELPRGTVALVKPDDWFYGADGRSYAAAYGPIFALKAEDVLGFKPKNSADWFLQVGEGARAVLIAGCKIHYAGLFDSCPASAEIYDAR